MAAFKRSQIGYNSPMRKASVSPTEKDLAERISDLIAAAGGEENVDLIRQIMITAVKIAQDAPLRGDVKIIHNALKEMRYAFKLFAPYREMPKVTIFGSARTLESEPAFGQAEEFARRMAENGFMVITGAGEGIMKGAQSGAGRKHSFGMNIQLPFEQRPNEFIENDPKLILFKYFFTRKLFFIKEADAIALFPGGFGTHDEGYEVLTMIQTGKADPIPVVFIDAPGGDFWESWRKYVEKEFLGRGFISDEDLHLFKITDDVGEAVEEVLKFYSRYHSLRYVHDRLIIRMKQPLPEGALDRLNRDFADLLIEGKIETTSPLPEEGNEPLIATLPRLSLRFNRRNFGRLRQLIDAINSAR